MQNEFTLRFNGGGEHREITAAHRTYKEIKVDPRGAILGSINQSGYQGCIKNTRLNGCRLPMENTTASPVSVISREGATEGCVSDVCSSSPCSRRFVCVDLWMNHECRCPPGYLLTENGTEAHCVYTVCASHPCKHGTCHACPPNPPASAQRGTSGADVTSSAPDSGSAILISS
ncbi:protein crumbs homolog 1-like [Spea bombifrons]|uniref:protein crumbs homolog 1-like n=1 Tax=Spea bombifrons TaxID=233779 RepID=UPI0023491ABE|nr:protein crumbs homolog 1-like [Spea bombifrons]